MAVGQTVMVIVVAVCAISLWFRWLRAVGLRYAVWIFTINECVPIIVALVVTREPLIAEILAAIVFAFCVIAIDVPIVVVVTAVEAGLTGLDFTYVVTVRWSGIVHWFGDVEETRVDAGEESAPSKHEDGE